jgi:hypothetical protein
MSYKNIPRKCSVCQGCGACDYEYEVEELREISGDYNPFFASLMDKRTDKQKPQDITELFNKQ